MYLNILIFIYLASIVVLKVSAQCLRANGYYSHETDCDRYYVCKNGSVVREGLCSDGLVFDNRSHRRLRCVHPFGIDCRQRAKTQTAKPTGRCPRRNGYYADREDCQKFYICDEGRAFLLSCAPGLAYDEYTGTCNWPDMVDGCSSEEIIQFSCPETSDNELNEFGYPRYAVKDCGKFVVCIESEVDGKRHPRLLGCEEGRVFNPVTKLCDYPEMVPNCENYYGERDFLRIRPLKKAKNFV